MSAVTLDRMSSRVCDCVATSPENQDLRVCESLPMQLHSMRMHSQQDTGKLLHGLRQPNQRRKLCFNVVGLGYRIAEFSLPPPPKFASLGDSRLSSVRVPWDFCESHRGVCESHSTHYPHHTYAFVVLVQYILQLKKFSKSFRFLLFAWNSSDNV